MGFVREVGDRGVFMGQGTRGSELPAAVMLIPADGTQGEWFHARKLKWLYAVSPALPIMSVWRARMRPYCH